MLSRNNRLFLGIVLAAFGLGSGVWVARAAEQELRVAQNNGNAVTMQVGPNTNPEDDDNANTMRVGPGNNRPREGSGNLYPNFANDVRVEVQIQPDMPFWHWGQTRPENTLPPAHNDPRRPGGRPEFRPGDRPQPDRRPPVERDQRPAPPVPPVAPERRR